MKTHKDGLEAAARYLEATALDFDQMAIRKEKEPPLVDVPGLRASIRNEARILSEKALLLRGQAAQIRKLK